MSDYVYGWGNNERRRQLQGRRCRIVARGSMRTVLVQFDDGDKVTTSIRALKRVGATTPLSRGTVTSEPQVQAGAAAESSVAADTAAPTTLF